MTLTVTDSSAAQASAATTASISAPTIPTDGIANLAYDTATNRITTAGFAYDSAGNQVRALITGSSNSQRFQYDAANRLTKVKTDDNQTVIASYTYGDSNERLILEEAGVRTYYACDGSAEYTESGNSITPQWSKTYIYLGARLLSTLTPNGSGGHFVQYHHPDRLGTRLVTNAQDTNYFEQQTLPFGTALNESPSAGAVTGSTNKRFTSYDRSLNTSLDYAINRHYDAQQGRFTQVDPIGMSSASPGDPQSLNMYAYCGNDPVNNIDPEGLFWGKLLKWVSKIIKWVGLAVLIAVAVVLTFYFAPGGSMAFEFFLWGYKTLIPFLSKYLGWTTGGLIVPGAMGTPQWNPNSRSVLGNSFQGQASGSSCPPDCQTQISLPPVSAGTIYANYSVWERTWRGLNIGLDKGLTTVVGFADFISFGGSKKAGKEFARVLGGDAAARDWARDNSEREGSWFHTGGEGLGLAWDIATGGAVVKGGLKSAGWAGRIALDVKPHYFPTLGKAYSHLQLDLWKIGVKGSNVSRRIPLFRKLSSRWKWQKKF